MEVLPHHVIELILEKLTVKPLIKFKSVSQQWRFTIESHSFQKRQQLTNRKQIEEEQYVLFVSVRHCDSIRSLETEAMRTLSVARSSVSVKIPAPWDKESYYVCDSSCDGLICLYGTDYDFSIVVNPATGWHRYLPPPRNYQLVFGTRRVFIPYQGFGKDKINNTYKAVWLYNSAELGLNHKATTCEVFDFTTNSWRYIVPASPYMILEGQGKGPVYANGSLHWFTTCGKVLSLDLRTEIFHVISETPSPDCWNKGMWNLDDRLCVSEVWPNQLVLIWLFDSDHKTWRNTYVIDLKKASSLVGFRVFALRPLAVLKNDKLLYEEISEDESLVTYDPKTESFDLVYKPSFSSYAALCYVPSLVSIL